MYLEVFLLSKGIMNLVNTFNQRLIFMILVSAIIADIILLRRNALTTGIYA